MRESPGRITGAVLAASLSFMVVSGCSDKKSGEPVDAGADAVSSDTGTWIDPPSVTRTFVPSDEIICNPERGFYRTLSIATETDFEWVRQSGRSLAFSYVRLDDYRERDLDEPLLSAVDQGFQAAREAGIKIILRFSYNFGPYPDSEPDASKEWISTHLGQLEPVLQQNADVIAVMQAGFIGAWGEWHTSTNGLLDDPLDKFDILEAILDALPASRAVQLRYPPYKHEGYGEPLTEQEAYSAFSKARVGHHNDCFLASDTDYGTYPSGEIERWKDYIASDTLFVPMGGETCQLNPPRSDCVVALAEMERFHYTYLNEEYEPYVVAAFKNQGCFEEMERRMGYRLAMSSVAFPEAVRPGGVMPLAFEIANHGWAAPMNPRPVWIVLYGPETYWARLELRDPRRFVPGRTSQLSARIQIPADAPPGSYTLALWLPDESSILAGDSRYAVRFANDGVWNEAQGTNDLVTIEVDPDAPGSADPQATTFTVLEESGP